MGALTGCCREGRLKEENEDMTSIEKKKLLSDKEVESAVDLLFSPEIYEKLLKGEKKEELIKPLTSFDNTSLFSIVVKVYSMLEGHSNSDDKVEKFKTTILFGIKTLVEEIKNNSLALQKEDANEEIQKNMINVISKLSELYHYLKFISSNGNSPYNQNLWKKEMNIDSYMKTQVFECTNNLTIIKNIITNNNNMISTSKEDKVEDKQKFTSEYIDGMFMSNAK